jgi:hypothetical protein
MNGLQTRIDRKAAQHAAHEPAQCDRAHAPARDHREHVEHQAAHTLVVLARGQHIQFAAGRAEASGPIVHRTAAAARVRFDRRQAGSDCAEQPRGRRGAGSRRGSDVLRCLAQLLELCDERVALTVVVERGDHAVERARKFSLACRAGRGCGFGCRRPRSGCGLARNKALQRGQYRRDGRLGDSGRHARTPQHEPCKEHQPCAAQLHPCRGRGAQASDRTGCTPPVA